MIRNCQFFDYIFDAFLFFVQKLNINMMHVSDSLSEVKNYINGKFERNGQNSMDVISPIDGSKISSIPLSTTQDVNAAVQAAKKAFPAWSNMTLKERVQIFFRYRTLLEKNMDELTKLVQLENGKIYGEAKAEVENGKISIRNSRKDTNEQLRKLLKEGASEDMVKTAEMAVQKFTDEHVKKVEAILEMKEKEIMTI